MSSCNHRWLQFNEARLSVSGVHGALPQRVRLGRFPALKWKLVRAGTGPQTAPGERRRFPLPGQKKPKGRKGRS